MQKVVKFVADDGTQFDDSSACRSYELLPRVREELVTALGSCVGIMHVASVVNNLVDNRDAFISALSKLNAKQRGPKPGPRMVKRKKASIDEKTRQIVDFFKSSGNKPTTVYAVGNVVGGGYDNIKEILLSDQFTHETKPMLNNPNGSGIVNLYSLKEGSAA